jgi:GT2 family glycosyltransferase
LSPTETYPQHVVTAVIVAHDGATWLPHVLDALLEQTRPVQRVVAVDTGSRDRSGAILTAKLGQGVVFGMDRATGYGTAVARALQHRSATTRVPARPGPGPDEHVEWIWLLHDDCEPAADALEQLLRGAAETPKAAVLGPKAMDWADRDVLLEAGLTIDTVGRRVTGVEPREVDQGQHDGDRDTLAVSSAGMLVRRDVWDLLHGFDPSFGLFREDIDFCWRVHAAGYRVRVVTDAVVFHVQGISRRRRAVSTGRRPALLDRRNALLTLAGNLPMRPMLASLAGNVTLSVLRALFFLVAKRVTAALDETAAVVSVLGHPLRLMRVRQMRARGRKAAYGRLRADIPPGRSVRRVAEFIAGMSRSSQADTRGSHHAATEDEADDFLLTDSGLVQRILTSPAVLLFLGLVIVTGVAERSLLGAGSLGGGALLPATQGASGLWREYFQGFHPVGIGSPSVTPPYLALVALLSTILLGKAWLAVDVLLLGSVPIAGMAAYRAARQVTASVPVRIWVAATYALIPVATGAIAAGRLGSAVAFAAVPVIGLLAGRMLRQPPRLARRAAWATGLAIGIGTAFVPLLWPVSLLAAAGAAVALRAGRPALLRNLGIVALVPPVLLVPWTFQLAAHPATMLLEVGVQQPGLASPDLPARAVLLLSPGGPGLPPIWVTAGLALAALVPLLAARRRLLVMSGWAVALLGLVVAVIASRLSVQPPAGGPPVTAWPGVALAITAAGLLLAAAAGGDSLGALLPRGRSALARLASARGLGVAVLVLAACSTPVLSAGFWLINGVSGPIGADSGQVVPAPAVTSASGGSQVRTLVLQSSGNQVTYTLLRGAGPALGDADMIPVPGAERALRSAVATLVAPAGGEVVSQGTLLARFDIGWVLMRAPLNQSLARTLNGVTGMRPVSITNGFDLWRLNTLPARVSVTESNGTVVPVPGGPVGVSGATVPAAGGTLTVAEPGGGWQASLNGTPLVPVASPDGSWATAFRLPPGGGTLTLSHGQLGHDLGVGFEVLAALIIFALALPGVRAAGEAQAASAAGAAGPASPEGTPAPAPAGRAAGSRAAGSRGTRGRAAATAAATAAAAAAGGTAAAGRAAAGGAAGGAAAGGAAAGGAAVGGAAVGRAAAGGAAPGARAAGAGAIGATAAGATGAMAGGAAVGAAATGGAAGAAGRMAADRAGGGRQAARDAERRGGKGKGRGLGRGRRRGGPDPATGAPSPQRARAAGGRGADRDRDFTPDAAFSFGNRAADGGPAAPPGGPARDPGRPAAWPAGQPASRFVSDPPSYSSLRGPAGYDEPDAYGRPDAYDPADRYREQGAADSGYDAGLDDPTARTAAFDGRALRDGGYGPGEYAATGSGDPDPDDYRTRDFGRSQPAAAGYGDYGRADYGSSDRPGADRPGADRASADRAAPAQPGAGRASGEYGADYRTAEYRRPDYRGADDRGADYGQPGYGDPGRAAASASGPASGLSRDSGPRSPTGAWPAADDSMPGAALPPPPPDRISRARLPGEPLPEAHGQSQYGQSQYGQSQYGQPQYGQPQYGRPQDGRSRPGQSPPGQSQYGQEPARSDWSGSSYGSSGSSWPDSAPPPPPPPARPVQPRADPGWPDDRWPDARRRGPSGPPAPSGPGGWPQSDTGPSWPDSQPGGTWSSAPQPAQPPSARPPSARPPSAPSPSGWSGGGPSGSWPGPEQSPAAGNESSDWSGGDSLEPLPSAELHHGAPPRGRPDDHSRRRWPAPDDEDERDAW